PVGGVGVSAAPTRFAFSRSSSFSRLASSAFIRPYCPPPVIGRLRHLQGLHRLRQLDPLPEHPIGLSELADNLPRAVPAVLHELAPLTHSTGSTKLSQRPDRSQGVAPATKLRSGTPKSFDRFDAYFRMGVLVDCLTFK